MNLPINTIICGDALKELMILPSESIDCVITSPPYWALRDYGVSGQIGLEPTFQEYINKLCDIFDEVKRVLKKSGTCWVNMGTTYAGNKIGKTDKKVSDYLKEHSFGINKKQYKNSFISEIDRAWLAALIDGEGCLQIHKQKRDNSVPSYQADISVGMIDKQMVEKAYKITGLGIVSLQNRGVYDWSVRGQQAGYLARIIYPYLTIKKPQARVLVSLCQNTKKEAGKTNGKNTKPENIDYREKLFILNKKFNQREIVEDDLPEPELLVNGVLEKCDIQIPSRFAIEMSNRGWILRNEIIWHKPNCMPSSVKDRFTVDFEKVFFFVKSKKYWFEQQTEPLTINSDLEYRIKLRAGKTYRTKIPYKSNTPFTENRYKQLEDETGIIGKDRGNRVHLSLLNKGSVYRKDEQRNKRCIWTITTKPFKEAHFATFPEKLIEPMIKAGCPEGGIVLDPFIGSGTTGVVAKKLGRNYLGIELNPDYITMANKRIQEVPDKLL